MAPRIALVCAATLWIVASCARPSRPPTLSHLVREGPELALLRPSRPVDNERRLVVARAKSFLAHKPLAARGVTFDPDPVGFARAAFWAAGLDLFDQQVAADKSAHGMQILYQTATARHNLHTQQPRPGDLLFLDASATRTADFPHQVAIVESIRGDGTIHALGRFRGGPSRIAINLRTPDATHAPTGKRVNDVLLGEDGQAPAARLFRSFADPFAD